MQLDVVWTGDDGVVETVKQPHLAGFTAINSGLVDKSGRMKIEYSATGNTQSAGVAITARTQATFTDASETTIARCEEWYGIDLPRPVVGVHLSSLALSPTVLSGKGPPLAMRNRDRGRNRGGARYVALVLAAGQSLFGTGIGFDRRSGAGDGEPNPTDDDYDDLCGLNRERPPNCPDQPPSNW
jgi:hypothetical protein